MTLIKYYCIIFLYDNTPELIKEIEIETGWDEDGLDNFLVYFCSL